MTTVAPTSRATSQDCYTSLVLMLASEFGHKDLEHLTYTALELSGNNLRQQFRQDNAEFIVTKAVQLGKIGELLAQCEARTDDFKWPSLYDCRDLDRFVPVWSASSKPTHPARKQLPLDRVYLEDLHSKPIEHAVIEKKGSGRVLTFYWVGLIASLVVLSWLLVCIFSTPAQSIVNIFTLCMLLLAAVFYVLIDNLDNRRSQWQRVCGIDKLTGEIFTGWKELKSSKKGNEYCYYFAFRFHTPNSETRYDAYQETDLAGFERMYLGQPVLIGYEPDKPSVCHAFADEQGTKDP